MKNHLFTFLLLIFGLNVCTGQEVYDTLYINMANGATTKLHIENIDSLTFAPSILTTPDDDPPVIQNSAALCWIDDDFRIEEFDVYEVLHDWCIDKNIRIDFAYTPGWSKTRLETAKLWEEEGFTFVMHPKHDGWYEDKTHVHDINMMRQHLVQCIREFQTNFASSRRTLLVFPGSSDSYPENIEIAKNYVECGVSATQIGSNSGTQLNKFRIKRFSLLIRNGYPKSRLKELIKQHIDNGDWLILYTHMYSYENTDVVDETTNSIANLFEMVEYANSLCPIRPAEVIWKERKSMYGY